MVELSKVYSSVRTMSQKLVKVANEEADPWIFLMCSCFIDYLVRLSNNKDKVGGKDYKTFIRKYLSQIDNRYRDFQFASGNKDLPEQMYHVLRSGIVHSFSLVPDARSKKHGGRARSILVCHRKNGNKHLEAVADQHFDSVKLTAEDFAEDLDKLVDLIFNSLATNDATLEKNIRSWFSKHPTIMALDELKRLSLL